MGVSKGCSSILFSLLSPPSLFVVVAKRSLTGLDLTKQGRLHSPKGFNHACVQPIAQHVGGGGGLDMKGPPQVYVLNTSFSATALFKEAPET